MRPTPGTFCESCLMPFTMDTGTRENPKYCSYCFKGGKLCFEGTKWEFQKYCFGAMRKKGIGFFRALFYMYCIGMAPRWKKA